MGDAIVNLNELSKIYIYHITDVSNLESIVSMGGLKSDAQLMSQQASGSISGIGYGHIKLRRLTSTQINCCNGRFVGEFVPFYFCPRSPMLYTVNKGNTGKTPGSQKTIVHLVSTVQKGIEQGSDWAFSDVSAATGYPNFYNDTARLDQLDWDVIKSNSWHNKSSQKQAEFLVADQFKWDSIIGIGCMTADIETQVRGVLSSAAHLPKVLTKPGWYF